MNTVAILERSRGALQAMVQLVCKAMEADAKDDPFLQQGYDALCSYFDSQDPVFRDAAVLSAKHAVSTAKEIDFKDATLPALMAMVVNLEKAHESELANVRELIQKLMTSGMWSRKYMKKAKVAS